MKRRIVEFFFLSIIIIGLSNLNIGPARAEEMSDQTIYGITEDPTTEDPTTEDPTTEVPTTDTSIITSIAIMQYPSKTNYSKGEVLDLTDMVVEAYYFDGTSAIITDYTVIGFDYDQVGPQTVVIYYQNQIASFTITIMPAKVTNVSVSYHDTASYNLTWDAASNVTRYEVYCLDEVTGTYYLLNYTYTNSITLYYPAGTINSFQICTVESALGIEYRSPMSDVFMAATNPEMVANLTVTVNNMYSIGLSWDAVPGATGYLVYRSIAATEKYVLCTATTDTTYLNGKLVSGRSYNYKVCAYTLTDGYTGAFSNIVDTSTNPKKVVLKYKEGEEKVRFTWGKVYGATSYDIYAGDNINGIVLLTSYPANGSTNAYIAEGLTTGVTYTFYAVARRDYKGAAFLGPSSGKITIEMKTIQPTSATGKLFPTKEDFLGSWSYTSLEFFNSKVIYSKSYAIPGVLSTNVGGFASKTMCPRGITFAGDYLLVSAYDMKAEENSVIYVLGKKSKKLLTTLVLPSKPHAGGLAFDGTNVWVTNGSKVSSILFAEIDIAAKSEAPYVFVNYNSICPLNIITSYVTYYDNKLWVGTYNELESTYLYSYNIENKDSIPSLTQAESMIMPNRIQGIAFTSIGTMLLSRSCQLYKGLRGYMRQIDTYKPSFSKVHNGVIPIGKVVNSVSMPSMNEGIAINGAYLYVNFESAAFDKSTYRMDRICAFKTVDVVKKSTK